jgi:FADH2 O2-dependent halogenase
LSGDLQRDIAVIGSGFAGSLMAMIARQLGRSVVLLERGTHPRVVVGESSTPLSNLLLEDLATRYNLPQVGQLSKWGVWQDSHPELACGLKRGFSFFHHELGKQQLAARSRENELLVAASPHDRIADTHWYRADFDWFLVRQAQELGVEYLDQVELKECVEDGAGSMALRGSRKGNDIVVNVRFVIDATGPRGFLHRTLQLGERELPGFPTTQVLYSHFAGVRCLCDARLASAPYPVENAAVHHVFNGGWVWLLRFNNGVTSAGVVAVDQMANQLNLREGARGWERLLDEIPALREQFAGAEAVQPFRHIARAGFRSASVSGDNWALLPSAAGFVDPLLSTGFPLTMLGIARLAEAIEKHWGADSFAEQLATYAAQTDAELIVTADLIGGLFANMGNFPAFAALSLLYFAAASYSETVRRMGKPHLAPSFLLRDHPQFGPECRRLLERARGVQPGPESEELIREVFRVIEPIDVAGLGRAERRNWYPVEAADLLGAADKVGASLDELMQMLERCGFEPATLRS